LNVTLENPNRARDHLANERTFLAWLRTGMSAVIFGFAIGRFGLALRQLGEIEGGQLPLSTGLSVYVGMVSILAGVVMVLAGLFRYRRTRIQLDEGVFEPAPAVIYLVAILSALFGLVLALYLILVRHILQ
jgi:putative membrane protein